MTSLRKATKAAVNAAQIILTFGFVVAGSLGAFALPAYVLGEIGAASIAWFVVALISGCALACAWLMFWATLLLPEHANERGRISETPDEDPRGER